MPVKIFKIQNFSVKDQGVELLKKFSLEIQKGEVITIVGQEGSGKNAIINGLIGKLPAEGKLFHMGQLIPFSLYDLKKIRLKLLIKVLNYQRTYLFQRICF
ncbi:hypothetical protein NAAC61_02745 [Petrotoga sp. 8T1HF07.NaAc.6.1]|uniref:ATP-binding cassette domain-containing protein n=1 Tax=Petrotoga sp. 8T1HF07.NaAc.6.1 TaxID=1351838 RepID=UPI00192C1277|nr:ATP-binding cassette domain-containing protein [Petrotoga sp. 8T1HF07.NaAc.6.1]MBL5981081.1 hypothetical protein [Petrotoga sp. 8T1HF07.NaAc.6.1]